jgi:hypothetical protein
MASETACLFEANKEVPATEHQQTRLRGHDDYSTRILERSVKHSLSAENEKLRDICILSTK